jgi:hypothetical protein
MRGICRTSFLKNFFDEPAVLFSELGTNINKKKKLRGP